MRKLAPMQVSYRDDFLISYRVYIMTESFHISLFEGTLHVNKIHMWFKIANIMHALPIPVYQKTDFTKTGGHFVFTWYRCEISYRSEILTLVQEPGGTHSGVTRAGMTFCGGIMQTNIDPSEGAGVKSPQGESRPGQVNTPKVARGQYCLPLLNNFFLHLWPNYYNQHNFTWQRAPHMALFTSQD